MAIQPPVLENNVYARQAFLTWLTNNSTGFNLQQNTNLSTANWTTVTNVPAISNQWYRVILPSTNRQDFFRLKSP